MKNRLSSTKLFVLCTKAYTVTLLLGSGTFMQSFVKNIAAFRVGDFIHMYVFYQAFCIRRS